MPAAKKQMAGPVAEPAFRKVRRKLSGFVLDRANNQPRSDLSVMARIERRDGTLVPVGLLQPDARGYVSFQVSPAMSAQARHIWIEVPGREPIDALAIDQSADGVSDFLIHTDAAASGQSGNASRGKSSIQGLDASDARRSPESIAHSPALLFGGDDACQIPVPNTQIERDYGLSFIQPGESLVQDRQKLIGIDQLWQTPSFRERFTIDPSQEPDAESFGPMHGELLRYSQFWRPIGYSLGDILYSLAMAPCESTKIAVIDWSRSEQGTREEGISATESLEHQQVRDRTIDEIVSATLNEYQGGAAAGAGVGGYYGVAFGAGVGTSHSWGSRSLDAGSSQALTDTVSQISVSMRGLRSTVVRQATENESDSVQTRSVRNHNRHHALTVQYHEVLRHYEVWTEFVEKIKLILLPFALFRFDRVLVMRFRMILQPALLDVGLRRGFRAVERLERCEALYQQDEPPADSPAPDGPSGSDGNTDVATVEEYNIKVFTQADGTNTHTDGRVKFYIKTKDGGEHLLHEEINLSGPTFASSQSPKAINKRQYTDGGAVPAIGLRVADISGVVVVWTESAIWDNWMFGGIEVRVKTSSDGGFTRVIGRTGLRVLFKTDNLLVAGDQSRRRWEYDLPAQPDSPTVPDGQTPPATTPDEDDDALGSTGVVVSREEDECLAQMLIGHLNDNLVHYSKRVWLGQDADERIMLLRGNAMLRSSGILDQIETTPVGVHGGMVAFPVKGSTTAATESEREQDRFASRIVSLAGRGVFAETHLSNCPASELRDPGRDRDAGEGCGDDAPAIAPSSLGTRRAGQDLTPSSLPANVLNIQNAPAAPDPGGLAAALSLMATPEIFRDMSLGEEVIGLVSGLASGAISAEQAQGEARRVAARGLGGAARGASGVAPTARVPATDPATHPSRTMNPRQLNDVAKVIRGTGLGADAQERLLTRVLDPGPAVAGPGDVLFASNGGQLATLLNQHPAASLQVPRLLAQAEPGEWFQNGVLQRVVTPGEVHGNLMVVYPLAGQLVYFDDADRSLYLTDYHTFFTRLVLVDAFASGGARALWLDQVARVEFELMIGAIFGLPEIIGIRAVMLVRAMNEHPEESAILTEYLPKLLNELKWFHDNFPEAAECLLIETVLVVMKQSPASLATLGPEKWAYLLGRFLKGSVGAAAATNLVLNLFVNYSLALSAFAALTVLPAATVASIDEQVLNMKDGLLAAGLQPDEACLRRVLQDLLAHDNPDELKQKLQEISLAAEKLIPPLKKLYLESGGLTI